ncbi:hypothetical protein AKJ16_DCAP24731 [Drosera capensis]
MKLMGIEHEDKSFWQSYYMIEAVGITKGKKRSGKLKKGIKLILIIYSPNGCLMEDLLQGNQHMRKERLADGRVPQPKFIEGYSWVLIRESVPTCSTNAGQRNTNSSSKLKKGTKHRYNYIFTTWFLDGKLLQVKA